MKDAASILDRTQADITGANHQEVPPIEAIRRVITPEHLRMITQTTGGFTLREDPKLPPHQTGYTNKDTKVIYYSPLYFKGSEEHGIEPEPHPEGFFYHEAGHHTEVVLALDNRMLDDLKNLEIPESYRGSPQAEMRFIGSVYKHLVNSIADIWLESYMSRSPYLLVRNGITQFQTRKGELPAEAFQSMSKPEQLMQTLLRSRYLKQEGLDEKLDQDVFESYQRIMKSGAMAALVDRRAFENYFATPTDHARTLNRKFAAYKEVILPEYLKLLENELEERKNQKQQQSQEDVGMGRSTGGAPLTAEEEQELVEQILGELERLGHEIATMSEEEKEHMQQVFGEIKAQLENPEKEGKQGQQPEIQKRRGLEAIEEAGRQLEREAKEKRQRGLAEALQVRERSIETWEKIKEKYQMEIESTASVLSEIFLDDRRKRLEYLRRECEIVPGLEYETIAAVIAGETDPETKMIEVRNPEFLEVEMEWIVDNSGSMSGVNIEKSIDLLVIVTEAFKKAKEDLEAENLVMMDEQPFRIGATKFTVRPWRVTKLDDPLNDEKELRMIDELSQIGGGTDETEAIQEVYKEMTLNKNNVIKMVFVLSDGYGNKEGVVPIIRQIEEDDEVIFLAMGLGDSQEEAQGVVDTYVEPLRRGEASNVFGYAAEDPNQMLPYALEFLKKQVEKKKQAVIY